MDEARIQFGKLASQRKEAIPRVGKVHPRDEIVAPRGNFGVLLAQNQPAKAQSDLFNEN